MDALVQEEDHGSSSSSPVQQTRKGGDLVPNANSSAVSDSESKPMYIHGLELDPTPSQVTTALTNVCKSTYFSGDEDDSCNDTFKTTGCVNRAKI